ncbi:unnamed protein product [Closterium sp. NIES-53]
MPTPILTPCPIPCCLPLFPGLSPPPGLLPLRYTAALNDLRHCAPTALNVQLAGEVERALAVVAGSLGRYSLRGSQRCLKPPLLPTSLPFPFSPLPPSRSGILAALNELRHCAPTSLKQQLAGEVERALAVVAGSLGRYSHTHIVKDSEAALFISTCKAFVEVSESVLLYAMALTLVVTGSKVVCPYVAVCFSRCYGSPATLVSTQAACEPVKQLILASMPPAATADADADTGAAGVGEGQEGEEAGEGRRGDGEAGEGEGGQGEEQVGVYVRDGSGGENVFTDGDMAPGGQSVAGGGSRGEGGAAGGEGTSVQGLKPATPQGSVGQPVSAASDGVVRHDGDDDHGTIHPEATNAARSQPRVTISALTNDSAVPSPMPLKPHRPPCFDPGQRGGPTIKAWLFALNVFFYANYVSEDTAKIRYAVSLLRGPAMGWWRVIVTKPTDYATLPTQEGQTGPWAPSYFVELPQNRTWDKWCAGLRAQFDPIAASIAARQKLRTWRQLGSVQDYTSGFLALCEQAGYMHKSERIDRYIGGLKHDIAQEIQLRGVTDFQEILAMAEKLDFFRRPRLGSYGSNSNWGHRSRGTNEGATIHAVAANAAVAPFKGRCFACNRPGHRKSECPENAKGKGEAEQQKQTKRQGNAGTLLKQYSGIFPDNLSTGLPPHRRHNHRIELEPGAQLTVQRQFRLTQPELDELKKHLDYLLEKEFIRPSSSPFAAPILFTPKKDGGFRMCIDYRALNRVTIKSRYPIPRADKLIYQLRTAQFFSEIDLRGGYHHIRVKPPDCPKTAFRTRYGSFEYTVMPFGLTNAPPNFPMTMNETFCPLLDKTLKSVKASKCEFLQDRLEFLGHIISVEGLGIDPKKIATIQECHAPTNLTELQSLLEFVNYVRRFVPDMAKLTAPLADLLRKGVVYMWGEKEQAAFSALKQILCSPPVLHIADPHRPFQLVTDASDIAVGAVLLQDFGNSLQPIAYESRKLHSPERNYPIYDREMLAIVHAFEVWRCYLTGADVTVRTDHRSLQYLRAQPNLNPRQIR